MNNIIYRKISDKDKAWINNFIRKHWGTDEVVVHKEIYYPGKLKGFVAEDKKRRIGLITYKIEKQNCEIVTLNSIVENKGIGTHLVNMVVAEAKDKKCKKIRLTTTNDNIKGIYFYQKLGFQLVNVYPNAVEDSRKIKPEIPMESENGIRIRDELEFNLKLTAI